MRKIQEIIEELKGHRQQITRAIVALQGISRQPKDRSRMEMIVVAKLVANKKDGTTGQVVPFVRRFR